MNKGWYWDDVTRQLYRWDDLIKLLREYLKKLYYQKRKDLLFLVHKDVEKLLY